MGKESYSAGIFTDRLTKPLVQVWKPEKKSMHLLLGLNTDILCEGHFGIFQPQDLAREYIERYPEEYE